MAGRPHLVTAGASLVALLTVAIHAAVAQTADQPSAAAAKEEIKEADKSMDRVLKAPQTLGVKPVATLSVEEARSQATPADAVRAEGKDPLALMTAMKDLTCPTAGGT